MWGATAPERIVPRHEAGKGEDHGVGRDLLLPQGTFDLLPVPRHNLVIVSALFKKVQQLFVVCLKQIRKRESSAVEEASVYFAAAVVMGDTHGCRR